MLLSAPVSSDRSAVRQLAAGADNLYLGCDYGPFRKLSFNGRGRTSPFSKKVLVTQEELRQIVRMAHDQGKTISYTANAQWVSDGRDDSGQWQRQFMDYVHVGLDAGVDSVIVGDMGALLLVAQLSPRPKITASTFFDTINVAQVHLLSQMGATRVVLSQVVHMSEIAELCSARLAEIEVFGHFGCSFFNGTCSLTHGLGEMDIVGMPCRNHYDVRHGTYARRDIGVFDSARFCSVCSVADLHRAGVGMLKLVGRENAPEFIAKITAVYRQIIDAAERGDSITALKANLPDAWQRWCHTQRCKYRLETPYCIR